MKTPDLWNKLPSVNDLLEHPQVKMLTDRLGTSEVATRVRGYLDGLREEVTTRAKHLPTPSLRDVVSRVAQYVARDRGWQLAGAINATGRLRGEPWVATPLAAAAAERAMLLSADFVTAGDNSHETNHRPAHDAIEKLKQLTGAESAAVLHSRAGAFELTIHALLEDVAGHQGPVVVSRSDVGEVAPGVRLQALCEAAGVEMREVGMASGATADDYRDAIEGVTGGVMLRLHAEEHRTVGGVPRPTIGELLTAASQSGATLIEDLAGGLLVDVPGLDGVEVATAAEAIREGAHLVILRGDGLVGGPDCTLLVGRKDVIDRLTSHRIAKTQQPSAATLAALTATLELLGDAERARFSVPVLSLLTTPIENLRTRAQRLAPSVAESPLVASAEPREILSEATPACGLPIRLASWTIALTPAGGSLETLEASLRQAQPAVYGRRDGEQLLLDLRTVIPRQDRLLVDAFDPPEPTETPDSNQAEGDPVSSRDEAIDCGE